MVVCIEFDTKLIGAMEPVTINVSIYSQIATVEKLSFQLRKASLLKLKDLITHAKKCFVVDLV